jgi:hypothetical protein
MSKAMTLALATALDITATGAQDAILCNTSPFAGGQGKNAFLVSSAAIGGSGVVKVQGNPTAGPAAPADDDANWADIVSLTSASPLRQEIEVPLWIRVNVTTAGTGTATLDLEGVQ